RRAAARDRSATHAGVSSEGAIANRQAAARRRPLIRCAVNRMQLFAATGRPREETGYGLIAGGDLGCAAACGSTQPLPAMAYLKIQTNLPMTKKAKQTILRAASTLVAEELGKPEEFVMIALQP